MKINREKNFISAVVYVYNNEDTIEYFLKNLNDVLNQNFEKYEIICVNDRSNDKSVEKIKSFAKNFETQIISIINMGFYQGLELSMNAGVDLSIGDFVYEFDSVYVDYPIDSILKVYMNSLKGFDIVSAVSNSKRKKSSQLFYNIFNRYSNSQYKLDTETFRILSRRAINRVHSMSKTIPYRKAMYSNCGLKIDSIKYDCIKNPIKNSTKQLKQNRQNLAIDSLILFTDIAYKMSIGMAFAMMAVTVITAIYAVVIFLNRNPIAGWTTTILFLSISFFAIFAILAIIIKYLSIIVDLVFKRQKYNVESIEKISK